MQDAWYAVEPIGEHVFHISDNGRDSIYLLVGSEKALLVDTGWGIPDLKALVAELTPLPVVVANSHGHPDHSNGNYQFSEAYIHPDDTALAAHQFEDEPAARHLLTMVLGDPIPASIDVDQWRKRETQLLPFPAEPLNLGGAHVRVVHTPGHTRGSVSFLIPEWRTLIVGDTVTPGGVSLFFDESADLASYKRSLETLAALLPEVDTIHWGHWKDPLDPALIPQIIRGMERIEAGEIESKEMEMFGVKGLQRQIDEHICVVTKP